MAATIVKPGKPLVFKFEEDGEHYMIGSQVGHSMKLIKGALYKRFPSLWRRCVTNEERKLLTNIGISYSNLSNASIILLKAKEVDDILKGNVQPYSPCSSPKKSPARQPKVFYKPINLSTLKGFLPKENFSPSEHLPTAIHFSAVGTLTTSTNPKGNTAERKRRRNEIMPILK